ncbi:hypothetical protein [Sphingomonas bacterium]|uniref:VgrG-related protein n=1 Tax=Sphingomonas bacterium TaxID=1895847 RepID=UPI00260CFCE6|nr:hypothetical protein [Sphingomonas bacterium]MDB5679846.1 hypothetical protein [Sphingomonas bacterium]
MRLLLSILATILFGAASASAHPAPCENSQQQSYEQLDAWLHGMAKSPGAYSLDRRLCVAEIVGQALGGYPAPLERLTLDRADPAVLALLAGLDGKGAIDAALNDNKIYQAMADRLEAQCTPAIRALGPRDLLPEQAAKCVLLRLPGTPYGLGVWTAREEGGGHYATISNDSGAGGWTYGKYQLASEAGGMESFLASFNCPIVATTCLNRAYRPVGLALGAAGGLAGAKQNSPLFNDAWTKLSLNSRLMQQAQEGYHVLLVWNPMRDLFRTDFAIDLDHMSCGFREAVFSIFTQHKLQSTKAMFSATIASVGSGDQQAIIRGVNDWRLARLGQKVDGTGFYLKYGAICSAAASPTAGTTRKFACEYIDGVRTRWEKERAELPKLDKEDCPPL